MVKTRKEDMRGNIRPMMNVGNETKVSIVVIEHVLKAINKSMKDVSI